MHPLIAAAFAVLQISTGSHAHPARGSEAAVVDSLEAATLRFVHEWRLVEMQSSILRRDHRLSDSGTRTSATDPSSLRTGYLFCNPGTIGVREDRAIVSKAGFYLACPSWLLGDSLLYDARADVDQAIDARFRPAVRQGRASLITLFDAAARSFPANDWIAGQRIRLLVDQRELDRALIATTAECAAARWWCSALAGFVLVERGDIARGDSAFVDATQHMSPGQRCDWVDLSLLFEDKDRAAYNTVPCSHRDSLNATIWWLSDPLYIAPGNERRAQHYARQVAIAIHSALDRDEWFDWRPPTGADALRETFMRYGWPSYMWQFSLFTVGYRGYPNFYVTLGSNTTFEYTPGRLQTVPAWRAIADPLSARSTDWAIADPGTPMETFIYADDRRTRNTTALAMRISPWWPRQHFLPREAIVQLRDGQVALLRRQSSVLLAAATDLDSAELKGSARDTIVATLLATESPESMHEVARGPGTIGTPLVLYGSIDARPTLVALEGRAAGAQSPAVRTRFAIATPPALSAMTASEFAISDPLLLIPPADGSELPRVTEQILSRMAGSTELRRGSQIGVYWETYGIAPTDSVEIAVWIERHTPQGILRRFGNALSVTTDPNTPVVQSWREGQVGRNAHVIPGAVPIVGRSIVLDASKLPAGDYWLDVVVRIAGRDPVRGRRAFTIAER